MAELELIRVPNPILFQRAEDVQYEELMHMQGVGRQMWAIMEKHNGMGLAAPQVGVSKRFIIGQGHGWRFALYNPRIIKTSKQTTSNKEGCLSVPGVKVDVRRPKQIKVIGMNNYWDQITIKARGWLAACLQHEIDHLNGIVIEE